MYDRISLYINEVHPSSQTYSLLRLLQSTPEYLCELCHSEIWDNAIVRGDNT